MIALRSTWHAPICVGLAAVLVFAAQAGPSARADPRVSSASPKEEITAEISIVEVRAGFAGLFKIGHWTPVEVTLAGGREEVTADVELTVLDGDAVPSRVRAASEITIAPGERTSVSLYAKVGRLNSTLTVGVRNQAGLLACRTFELGVSRALEGVLPSSATLILALGSPFTAQDASLLEEQGAKVASVDDWRQLPRDWWGYDGVDTVVLATDGADIMERLAGAEAQLAALARWVNMGGKLVMSVGRQAENVLSESSPLAGLAPGKFEALVPLRQGTPFETYAETSEPLQAAVGTTVLQVPKLAEVRGKIEAFAGNRLRDLPLVVRAPHGFGEVAFVAADLNQPPFSKWPARMALWEKLAGRSQARATKNESQALGQVATLGFDDLAGQLLAALDQFSGVQVVPFWLVAALVLAYIGCIGPLDYFVVKTLLRRMEATWLTFAVTVLVFSGGAFFLAYALKGNELRVNRLDLVDFDVPSARARGTSWANVFSPKIDTYNLALTAAAATAPAPARPTDTAGVILSWMGLPGGGFGGMDSPAGRTALFTVPYGFSRRLDRLDHVPIAVWSSKAFIGRWWQTVTPPLEARLVNRDKLVGTLESRLDVPLEDCVLFFERWAYPLRQLKPGQIVEVETDLDPQRADTYLRHVTLQADRNLVRPYDRASFDIPRIVEVMSFYELAGGQRYVGLTHQYQGFADLSDVVNNGRAVLIGRVARPATSLARDGEPIDEAPGDRWTFHRYVFAVDEGSPP